MTHNLSAPASIYEGAAGFGKVPERPFEEPTVKVGVDDVTLVCLLDLYNIATDGDFEQNTICRRSFSDPLKMTNEEYGSAIEPPLEVGYDQADRLIYGSKSRAMGNFTLNGRLRRSRR